MDPLSTVPPTLFRLDALKGRSAHDHRVRQFSGDFGLIERLRVLATDESGAVACVRFICSAQGVEAPELTFHGGRGSHTGYCQSPVRQARARFGASTLRKWEQQRGTVWPEFGMIRLGRRPALATIAHEVGHHLVHVGEVPGIAPHGRLWVAWFDVAASAVVDWGQINSLDLV
ncbi:hypothetical protein HQ535_00380 [bacterium]|nr:hypothetical protein [bacterium]